jgi:SAM-dependent methyltransferase
MLSGTKQIIRDWWASSPMTYGLVHGESSYETEVGSVEAVSFGTRKFFERLDQVFYGWNTVNHSAEGYFGKIFPYAKYEGKDVLEVGCGLGTMAMNWAQHNARITAVDLNPVSVEQTTQRLKLYDLPGAVMQMDANKLSFENATFDYAYSWGVLHHSPDLDRSISELLRVVKKGGGFGVMLYNRASLYHWYLIRYVEGFLHAESKFLNPLQLTSRYTDGAQQEGNPHTWPVTPKEMRRLFSSYSKDIQMKIFQDIDFAFPPKLLDGIPPIFKKTWARRWGWSMWISGTKG